MSCASIVLFESRNSSVERNHQALLSNVDNTAGDCSTEGNQQDDKRKIDSNIKIESDIPSQYPISDEGVITEKKRVNEALPSSDDIALFLPLCSNTISSIPLPAYPHPSLIGLSSPAAKLSPRDTSNMVDLL